MKYFPRAPAAAGSNVRRRTYEWNVRPTVYWNQVLQAEAVEEDGSEMSEDEWFEQMGAVERAARFGWLRGWGPIPACLVLLWKLLLMNARVRQGAWRRSAVAARARTRRGAV